MVSRLDEKRRRSCQGTSRRGRAVGSRRHRGGGEGKHDRPRGRDLRGALCSTTMPTRPHAMIPTSDHEMSVSGDHAMRVDLRGAMLEQTRAAHVEAARVAGSTSRIRPEGDLTRRVRGRPAVWCRCCAADATQTATKNIPPTRCRPARRHRVRASVPARDRHRDREARQSRVSEAETRHRCDGPAFRRRAYINGHVIPVDVASSRTCALRLPDEHRKHHEHQEYA